MVNGKWFYSFILGGSGILFLINCDGWNKGDDEVLWLVKNFVKFVDYNMSFMIDIKGGFLLIEDDFYNYVLGVLKFGLEDDGWLKYMSL